MTDPRRGFRFAGFELLPTERRLLRGDASVHLGGNSFDVLVALVERAGQLVTKEQLLSIVWGKVVVEENTLQQHVAALRKALGSKAIATVIGHGYRFVPAVTVLAAADARHTLLISGTGDVIQPTDGVIGIGSGGNYALAAARALLKHTELSAREIVEASLGIAGEIDIYTNAHIAVEDMPCET